MEILGIGPGELILIFILALIFIGPGKMPEVAASLGKALREFQRASAELTDALNAEIAAAEAQKAARQVSENGHSQEAVPAEDVVAQAEAVALAASSTGPVAYLGTASAVADETVSEPAFGEPGLPTDQPMAAAPPSAAETPAGTPEARPTGEPSGETGVLFGLEPLPAALLTPSTANGLVAPVAQATPETLVQTAGESAPSEPSADEKPSSGETGTLFGLDPLPASLLTPSAANGSSPTSHPTQPAGPAPTDAEEVQPTAVSQATPEENGQTAAVADNAGQAEV